MSCIICSLRNIDLQNDIERLLDINQGYITDEAKKELKVKYPNEAEIIGKISQQEYLMHWNFHQSSSYLPAQVNVSNDNKQESKSLRDDIGKSEAAVLYDIMSKQMETFNRLTHKINDAIDSEESDVSHVIINPVVGDFYKGLTDSMRATIKELRELNDTVNGKTNGSLDGLKAIALAISQPLDNSQAVISNTAPGRSDMSTDKFDY